VRGCCRSCFTGPNTVAWVICDTRKSMYKRIVLKLSGEVLAGPRGFGLDADKVTAITDEIVDVHHLGVEIGVVVGGGKSSAAWLSRPRKWTG